MQCWYEFVVQYLGGMEPGGVYGCFSFFFEAFYSWCLLLCNWFDESVASNEHLEDETIKTSKHKRADTKQQQRGAVELSLCLHRDSQHSC